CASVAMTNGARLHFYTTLSTGPFWNMPCCQFPISAGVPGLRRFPSLIHEYLVLVCLFNRFVWQEARRELFHRAESVCEKRYQIVVRERSGVVGSTSRLHRRGNAGAVTSRSPRRKQLRQRRKGRFHSRFLA